MIAERIFLSSPDVGQLEEQAVLNAVRSGWIAPLGPDVEGFENELAQRTEVEHAVALNSGTAALHLALLGVGVKPGDVVVTTTMTFAATANAIAYCGAEPYFVDCVEKTGNIDPWLLGQALEKLVSTGEHVAAIVPVDLLGKTADYTALEAIGSKYDIPLVADSAESLGAVHKGRPAGSFGKASALSFNGNKIMTSSGGGALLTNDASLASRARYLATQARQPVVHYEHNEIGYNYRLSNILAALGRAQLARLDEMIGRRRLLRDQYKELFSSVDGVTIFGVEGDEDDNAWLTSIIVNRKITGWSATDLRETLSVANIESRPLWKPMHLQPVFKDARGLITGASERLFSEGLTLPSGSVLRDDQIDRVLTTIQMRVGGP